MNWSQTMEGASVVNEVDDLIDILPPGFRFHPTDEEIITHYLTEKVMNSSFSARAIGEVDLNKCEPWDLPKKAKMGEKEWYFFCQRDRKYPTGMRTNRATESGYWKATGKDKEIYKGIKGRQLVGMKKTLVFYKGRAPKGEKSNWVTHEYRLEGKFSYYGGAKDEWVVCRVFHKNSTGIRRSTGLIRMDSSSFGDDLLDYCLPPLMDYNNNNNDRPAAGSSFTHDEDELIKGTTTAAASPTDGNYLSYFSSTSMNHEDQQLKKQQDHNNNNKKNFLTTSSNSIFHPHQILQLPNHQIFPSSFLQPSPINYLNPDPEMIGSIPSFPAAAGCFKQDHQAILRASKHIGTSDLESWQVEQFSSSSMVSLSQDTGLSTDMTTEISSVVVSKQDMGRSNSKSYDHDRDREVDLDPNYSVGGRPISDFDCIWNN